MAKLLPNNIGKYLHIQAIDDVFAGRMASLSLEVLMVYLAETVEENALPFLAEQFGVNGFAGWIQSETIEQKRAIIKNAINLQRRKGTVYAIKEAIKSVGLGNATLIEGAGTGQNGWAEFLIEIQNSGQAVDVLASQKLTKLVLEYKNERSHFLGLSFGAVSLEDDLFTISDNLELYELLNTEDQLIIQDTKKLDGSWKLDGLIKLGNANEQLDIL